MPFCDILERKKIVRFYIDSATGETYITEYVSGITDEEEPTGETFNVKDYFKKGE